MRDYKVKGQVGREPMLEDYVQQMVQVGREVRRVLRRDGTFWMNIGGKYMDRNLTLVPERVAQGLQESGWVLRSRITWMKINPMPISAKNRPNDTTETILLLTPRKTGYYYDSYADMEASDRGGLRRAGDVWSFATTTRDRDGHVAVFPPELPRRCVMRGTSPAGCCPRCGTQYRRVVGEHKVDDRGGRNAMANSGQGDGNSANRADRNAPQKTMWFATTEWTPGCACDAGAPVPCTVLDAFVGSGTTVEEAVRLGRCGVGVELNPGYAADAQGRVARVEPPTTPPDLWLVAGDVPTSVAKLPPEAKGFCNGLLSWRTAMRLLAVLPTPYQTDAAGGRPRMDPLVVVERLVQIARNDGAKRDHTTTYRRVKEWARSDTLGKVVTILDDELRRSGEMETADRLHRLLPSQQPVHDGCSPESGPSPQRASASG